MILDTALNLVYACSTKPACPPLNSGVYLESAIVEEHHEGAVGLQPLQQVQSGHVCV